MKLFQYSSRIMLLTASIVCAAIWLYSLAVLVILRIRTGSLSKEEAETHYKAWFPDALVEDMGKCAKSVKWVHILLLALMTVMWLFGSIEEQRILLTLAASFGKICVWTLAAMLFFAAAYPLAGGRSERAAVISRSIRRQTVPMFVLIALYCAIIWLFG